jgi:hypothetical protein
MKNITKKHVGIFAGKTLKAAMAVLCLFSLAPSFAQNCKTNSLTINTGYDPVTNTKLTVPATDPNWNITAYSTDLLNLSNTTLATIPTTGPATVTNNMNIGITSTTSEWVCFYDPTGNNWSTFYETNVAGTYSFKMTREFKVVCQGSNITFNIDVARDNYVKDFRVLNSSSTVVQSLLNDPTLTTNNSTYYSSFQNINVTTTSPLPPDVYTIEITVHNLSNPLNQANPHGVHIRGTVTSPINNLVAPGNADCDCECEDKCYWKVEGNNILNGNNIFGTLTNDDVLIKTNNTDRGTMTNIGLLGWNTITPTAYLHVNCSGNNPDGEGGSPATASDIRFENLEHGNGTILAIDASGYVYNTNVDITDIGGGSDDGMHWDLNGNMITGPNFFGTNSPHDVILRTSGIDKGIFTSGTSGIPFDDGRLGWQTLTPTAHLHINCNGGNPQDGSAGSDVRFEELERGRGKLLVIDDQGYVYNSMITINDDGSIEIGGVAGKMSNSESKKIESLEKEVEELKAKLNELINCCSSSATSTKTPVVSPEVAESILFQNTPNPFGKETTISYNIKSLERSAFVAIYDLNGKEIYRHTIESSGQGQVIVNSEKLVAGMYVYSLVIDGTEVDSKRMIVTK